MQMEQNQQQVGKNTTAEKLLSYTRKHKYIQKNGNKHPKKLLKNKKQTVKANMFNCLLNDKLLMEVIGNIAFL